MIDPQSSAMSAGNGRNRTGVASASESEDLLPPKMHALAEPVARVREFIRAHPLPVVLGALVLGFVGARWVRED
jgi:hypothetical protein